MRHSTVNSSSSAFTFRPLCGSNFSAMPVISNVSLPVRPSDSAFSPAVELQRQDAHTDEVAAVDALEALGDRRTDALQERSLRRPIARRTAPVLLAGDDDQRRASSAYLTEAS